MPTTILVVEDHDTLRKFVREWLALEFPCCRVVAASCGEEAIALTRIESPRVVVTGISLPGMNGIDVVRQIKAILPCAHFVMLTIHEEQAYRAEATLAGASAYVPKRLILTELIPAIAALLTNDGDCESV
ncbi:hypothetical protein LCGC14_1316920 [marine sediment metagenome]|uniref:Response regulatory domain-containing protein n=1 Tax=marine sediment metagenome TaxID=412755 RepID=A0A0F9KKN0_9ZZZZ